MLRSRLGQACVYFFGHLLKFISYQSKKCHDHKKMQIELWIMGCVEHLQILKVSRGISWP